MNDGGTNQGAGAAGVRRHRERRRREPQRLEHVNGPRRDRDVLGRHRPDALDAAPGPRQLGDRLGRQRRAARALRRQVGGNGDHRARGRLRLRRDPHDRRPRRGDRRVHPERREDLRHLRRARRPDRRLGLARPQAGARRDQVVRGRALEPRPEARPPRAQARDQGLGHRQLRPRRLPRTARRTCSGRPRSTRRSRSAARCRPSTTPGRWSPAMAVGRSPRLPRAHHASCSPRPGSRSTTTSRQCCRRPPPPSCSSSRPTTRPSHLLTLEASWMADNNKPNSLHASYAKAKAGRSATDIALRCVALCGSVGLRRGRAAREVGPRREDPRHLRGHPADPASDHRPAAPGQDFGRAQVAAGAHPNEQRRTVEREDPPRRRPRGQPDPVRALERRLREGLQPGHAHRRARRAGRPLQSRRGSGSARWPPAPCSSTAATST